MNLFRGTHRSGILRTWGISKCAIVETVMNTSENQMHTNSEQKPENRLSRDGFAALAIGSIAAVLVFVMFKHFVS